MTRARAATTAVVAALTLCLGGCSATSDQAVSSSPAATAASASDDTQIAVGSGTTLPDTWPADLPGFDGGSVVTAVVADGGDTVNAVWQTELGVPEAWAQMSAALTDAGYRPSADSGTDQFVQTDEQTTDTFTGPAYEANVVVVAGDVTTVMLNASRLTP